MGLKCGRYKEALTLKQSGRSLSTSPLLKHSECVNPTTEQLLVGMKPYGAHIDLSRFDLMTLEGALEEDCDYKLSGVIDHTLVSRDDWALSLLTSLVTMWWWWWGDKSTDVSDQCLCK